MNRTFWILLIVAGIAAPFIGLYPVLVMKLLCFALFACAFNLLLGYTGLLSFGHAAFFGGAAYVAGHAAKVWGLTPELAILTGGLTAAGLGYLFGALSIRRQGIYFAMVTLALAQIVYFVALKAPFTGGEDGLQGIPRGSFLGLIDLEITLGDMLRGLGMDLGERTLAIPLLYFFVLAIFLGCFWLIARIIDSPFGHVLKAIRENEPRALSLGYNVNRYKLIAFIMSATLAGVAGATKAIVMQIASLTDVMWQMSGEVVLMTLLGGMGTIFGPMVGSFVVITAQTELSHLGSWVMVTIGLTFIACVMLFRRGIVGEIEHLFQHKFRAVKIEQQIPPRPQAKSHH